MNVKIKDIAKALDGGVGVSPEFFDKVTKVAEATGVKIVVKSEAERKTLLLIAELMDNAEEVYREQRGLGKDKFSSVLSTVISVVHKDSAGLFEIVKGVTHIVEHLKTIYKLIK